MVVGMAVGLEVEIMSFMRIISSGLRGW